MAPKDSLSPPIKYYGIGVALGIIGIVLAVITSSTRLETFMDSLVQIKVPSRTEIALLNKGPYLIFDEYSSVYEGKAYVKEVGFDSFSLSITAKDSGQPLELLSLPTDIDYSFFGRAGRAIGAVEVTQPGFYFVEVRPKKGATSENAILVISRKLPSVEFNIILSDALLILLFSMLIAGAAFASVFILRRQAAKPKLPQRL